MSKDNEQMRSTEKHDVEPELLSDSERDELAAKIGDQFADVYGEDYEEDTSAPADEDVDDIDDDVDAEDADIEDDEDAAEEPDEDTEGDAEDAEEGEEEAADPSAPTLPEAYRRTLKAYEWTDEEIDENLGALGSAFIDTAARLHKARNAETARMAQLGREARERQNPTPDPAPERKPSVAGLPTEFKTIDAERVKSEFGDDEVVEYLVNPVNDVIQQMNQILPVIHQAYADAQQTHVRALQQELSDFFEDGEIAKSYAEIYGGPNGKPTAEQIEARNRVIEAADAYIAGAEDQNRTITVRDALFAAHDHVASDYKEKAIRRSVTKKAKQRNRGISTKPSRKKGSAAVSTEKPENRNDLERVTAQRMREAGILN